jgi:broad specificity phosphatase PhoE
MRALYVTHPQVNMDASVPVPLWGLSPLGRERALAFAARGIVPPDAMIFSSRETKAMELADILAAPLGALVLSDHLMGENDRSATGFLPPELFEATADRFFAEPETSVDGWERAIDAQRRIVDTVATALNSVPDGIPAIFCGHGAVGTLLNAMSAAARSPAARIRAAMPTGAAAIASASTSRRWSWAASGRRWRISRRAGLARQESPRARIVTLGPWV